MAATVTAKASLIDFQQIFIMPLFLREIRILLVSHFEQSDFVCRVVRGKARQRGKARHLDFEALSHLFERALNDVTWSDDSL